MPDTTPRSILITGASRGIGAALARAYAAPGVALALTGRDRQSLEAVAAACRAGGATVLAETVDVRDRTAMADFVNRVDGTAPLSLVIANAGIGADHNADAPLADRLEEVFAVNVTGVFHTVMPALEIMQARGAGQIAIMSSLAGYLGFPKAPAYCPAKAAVKTFGESLRAGMRADGVKINVICPGFVTTRMTENTTEPMPFLVSAEKAAAIIKRGLERNKGRIAFPRPMALGTWFLAALPYRAREAVLRIVPVWT